MRANIIDMLFGVVDELNQLRPPEEHLPKDLGAALAGDAGRLDSAGLINLIVLTEQRAAAEIGASILLTDERTLSQVDEVFRTLGSLADYLLRLLDEKRDG